MDGLGRRQSTSCVSTPRAPPFAAVPPPLPPVPLLHALAPLFLPLYPSNPVPFLQAPRTPLPSPDSSSLTRLIFLSHAFAAFPFAHSAHALGIPCRTSNQAASLDARREDRVEDARREDRVEDA
eukprot:121837-Chlamydomonas_euryale.AAC.2